jgi:hypothetical protein
MNWPPGEILANPDSPYFDIITAPMTAFRVSARRSTRMSRGMFLIKGLISQTNMSGKVRLNVTDSF